MDRKGGGHAASMDQPAENENPHDPGMEIDIE
jgi:hypothetical protein